jgi:trigger factor
MQLTIQDISPVEKRVDFELPWTEVAPRLDKAYNELRRDVRLKGFRPGKAPRPVLEKLYRGNIEEDVARELVELSLGQAIREKQIDPVAPPRVDRVELKSGQPFKFSARVEVRSQVEPKDYAGIPVERRPAKVTDEQLAEALESYRKQLTNYVSVEGRDTAAASDVLLVELNGRVGEHKIKKNSTAVDLSQTGDDEGPLPGLAAQLTGVAIAAGTVHDLKYTIPAEVRVKELAGKEVSLKSPSRRPARRRFPRWTTSWPRTPARPTPWRS